MISKLLSVAILVVVPACAPSEADACNRVFRSSAVVQSFVPASVLVPTIASSAVFQQSIVQQAVAQQVCNVQAVQVPLTVQTFAAPVVFAAPVAVQQVRTRTVIRSRSRILGRRRGW
jgi:hypothetical protein